ncbi:MAG: NlpC/P60 family protein [Lachnospiraceae bacterium]|nr:NlpC/P60 family protein [Lachnospiraceae bacterium]
MYSWVNKYVGIPFVSLGRTMEGCDCYGLIRLILLNEYNYKLPLLTAGYSDALETDKTSTLFQDNVPLIISQKIEAPEEKAVALIQTRGLLSHVALYAGDDYIIHARHKTGVVCERLTSPWLSACIRGWYRVSESYRTAECIQHRKDRI